MLEASLEDTINMTGLETIGNHLPDEFINIPLGLSLEPEGREKITYETLHKGWGMIWCLLLDATERAYEIERDGYGSNGSKYLLQ